jgi:WD40 repeat protein
MRCSFRAAGPTGSEPAEACSPIWTRLWHRDRVARHRRVVPKPMPGKGGSMEITFEKNHVRAVAQAGPVLRAVAGMALALLVCASLAGCDKATKHKPVKYNIYLGASMYDTSGAGSFWGWIYAYDADSLDLVDSINLNLIDPTGRSSFVDEMAVSPDGRWLYVLAASPKPEPSTLWKLDARTKQAVWSRPGWDDTKRTLVRVLQNGALLLVGDTVFRSEDGSVLRTAPDSLFALWGPASGTKVAATVRSGPGIEDGSIVRVVDVLTGEVSGRYAAHLESGAILHWVTTARLHPDGRRVLAVGISGGFWLVVGDLETGQTLFQYRLNNEFGYIAISDDGLLAAVTDASAMPEAARGRVYVVDLQTLSVTIPTPPAALLHRNWAAQICFLPGDRRVATCPESSWDQNWGPLSTIDVTTMQFEKSVWLPNPRLMFTGGMGVGPRP